MTYLVSSAGGISLPDMTPKEDNMATETPKVETEVEKESDKALETRTVGTLSQGLYNIHKIGKINKGDIRADYNCWKIEDSTATDPAELVSDVLSFLDDNFAFFKKAVINGANQQRRFMDAPKEDPFVVLERLMAKSGLTPEQLLEHFSK